MRALIRFFGSLSFAIFLIAALGVLLIVSTTLESRYGTPFAQRVFYSAGWFDVFLSLLALNILCSALSRWPYKRSHAGFLVTHFGILILLAGSLLSRLAGIEGQMALVEGEQKAGMLLQDYQLVAHGPDRKVRSWDLKASRRNRPQTLEPDDAGRRLTIERIEEGVFFSPEIRASGDPAVKNRAVRFSLASEKAGFRDSFWLVENSPEPSFSRRLSLGVADLELRESPRSAADSPRLSLIQKGTEKAHPIPLRPGAVPDAALAGHGLRITDITYFPEARVDENNKIVNASDEPKNPAVRFTLRDEKGHREERILFTLFPDFEAIHGKQSGVFDEWKAELLAPESQLVNPSARARLLFYMPGDKWTFESRSSKGKTSGDLRLGEEVPTGWMDFTFRVEELLEDAVIERKMKFTGSTSKGDLAVHLSLAQDGRTLGPFWASPGIPAVFDTPEGPLTAVVGVKSWELPFRLKLLDFRKKVYPGTNNPASYESDVVLEDTAEKTLIQKTVWMNHPLDYKGFRIFQSSYIEDPAGDTSIFTIAKNPGIWLIYSGSIILFTGVILVFYVKPLSSLHTRGPHVSQTKKK